MRKGIYCPYCDTVCNTTEDCEKYVNEKLKTEDSVEIYCTCDNCKKDFIVTRLNHVVFGTFIEEPKCKNGLPTTNKKQRN